jgi:REP element-mobilizing transposase RayT
MRCRSRTPLTDGTFYASRKTKAPQLIFREPRDYEDFRAFLMPLLERTDTTLLGYCWMPDSIHLALGIGKTPLSEVMRRITGYCTRRINKRSGTKGHYTDSFPVMLKEPATDLPKLLRYIHYIPVTSGVADSPEIYPYSSVHRP